MASDGGIYGKDLVKANHITYQTAAKILFGNYTYRLHGPEGSRELSRVSQLSVKKNW